MKTLLNSQLSTLNSAVTVLIALALTATLRAAPPQRFLFEKAEMGLPFRVTLYAASEAEAKAAADAAFARIAALNSILSDYDPDSELSRLSRTSGEGKAVPVSPELWTVLERGRALSARTDGAFDVTVGPLVNIWRRARHKQELPGADLVAEMQARVGWKNMVLNPAAHTVQLTKPEMRLDCGSIGKGYAIDAAFAVLRDRGFPCALVGGSGDMMAGDPPPGEPGWRIEVAASDAPAAPPGQIVFLKNSAIGTSGDLFQHVEIEGVRYSHIVDPHTGLGLTDHSLVSVLGPDCTTADSLATAVSVLGPERGLRLIEDTPGFAVRIVRQPGEKIEFVESSRWPRGDDKVTR